LVELRFVVAAERFKLVFDVKDVALADMFRFWPVVKYVFAEVRFKLVLDVKDASLADIVRFWPVATCISAAELRSILLLDTSAMLSVDSIFPAWSP
jgi:hypothetical protein